MAETPDWRVMRPHPALRPFVSAYLGYRVVQPRGIHRGLPSGAMTFIVSIAGDIEILRHVDPVQSPSRHGCVVGGLHTAPALVARGGLEEGVAIELTPLGSRALLRRPAADLVGLSVDGSDVLGRTVDELRERIAGAATWRARFAAVDDVLLAASDADAVVEPTLAHGWRLLARSRGRIPVGALADEVGWSRRHLAGRFRAEFGLGPKAVGRTLRFGSAVASLRREPRRDLATVAAACGYYDQAHLTREFHALAGCPPAAWLREEFPSVQDTTSP